MKNSFRILAFRIGDMAMFVSVRRSGMFCFTLRDVFRYFTGRCRLDVGACSTRSDLALRRKDVTLFRWAVCSCHCSCAWVHRNLRYSLCFSLISIVVLARSKVEPLVLLYVSFFVDDCGWQCSSESLHPGQLTTNDSKRL